LPEVLRLNGKHNFPQLLPIVLCINEQNFSTEGYRKNSMGSIEAAVLFFIFWRMFRKDSYIHAARALEELA
jgi:hypothetical protein